jgi:hypothetical protein
VVVSGSYFSGLENMSHIFLFCARDLCCDLLYSDRSTTYETEFYLGLTPHRFGPNYLVLSSSSFPCLLLVGYLDPSPNTSRPWRPAGFLPRSKRVSSIFHNFVLRSELLFRRNSVTSLTGLRSLMLLFLELA